MKRIFKDNPRPFRHFYNDNKWAIIITMAVMVIASFVLLYGPNVGLSDNGDYPRFTKSNYIFSLDDDNEPFCYFYDQYKMDIKKGFFETSSEGGNPYYSPHFLFIQLSKVPNFIYNKITGDPLVSYHIGWLALIYICLYALSLGMLVQALKEQSIYIKIFASILLLIAFCDQGYLLYFNSFYGEAAGLVLTMLTMGLALQILSNKGGRLLIILYYGCVFLLSGSKFTNIPSGILFGIIGLLFIGISKDKLFKYITVGCFIGAGVSIYLLAQTIPTWMDDVTNYQSVFFGILKNSETPKEDLQALNIDPQYSVLQNTHGYMGDNYPINIYTDTFKKEFYDKISKDKLLKFYLVRPNRLIQKLEVSAKNTAYISPPYLGQYGTEKPRFEPVHRFDFWGKLRLFLQFDRLEMIITYFIGAFSIFILEVVRWQKNYKKKFERSILLALWLAIIASASINFIVPIVANGEADLSKHMFGFIHYFDLLVIIIWIWIFKECITSRRILKLVSAILIFLVSVAAYSNVYQEKYDNLQVGAYVQMGTFHGKPLLWQIIHMDDQSMLLFSKEVITKLPYDDGDNSLDEQRKQFGSNEWMSSDIRIWLNGPFLDELGIAQTSIMETEHRNYLSETDKGLKEKGSHPLFWTFVSSMVDWDDEEAYNNTVKDKIFLLDGYELSIYLEDNDLSIQKEEAYWLRTPMTSSSSMVRYMNTDGFILHKDANSKELGIVPALRVNKEMNQLKGEGSLKEPFIIE